MMAPAAAAVAEEFVLCEGVLHPVVAGRIACPNRGATIQVEACAEYRLLTWRCDDRGQLSDCSTESRQDR